MTSPAHPPLRLASLLGAGLLLSACATSLVAPPTGWVSRDDRTGRGVFIYNDGSRYEGGFRDDKPFGEGAFFWPEQDVKGYKSVERSVPWELRGGSLAGSFNEKGQLQSARVVYRLRQLTYEGARSGPVETGGFSGPGVVTYRKSGVRLEGSFASERLPFEAGYDGDRVLFSEAALLGSHVSGEVRIRSPKGTEFVGRTPKYRVFQPGVSDAACFSAFYGVGRLSAPGKPPYEGLVYFDLTNDQAAPTTLERAQEALAEQAQCAARLHAAKNQLRQIQDKREAEIAQARREASAWLASEIARRPAQLQRDMERTEMALRGTSPEQERQKVLAAGIAADAYLSRQNPTGSGAAASTSPGSTSGSTAAKPGAGGKPQGAGKAGSASSPGSRLSLASSDGGSASPSRSGSGSAATTGSAVAPEAPPPPKMVTRRKPTFWQGSGDSEPTGCDVARSKARAEKNSPTWRVASVGSCSCDKYAGMKGLGTATTYVCKITGEIEVTEYESPAGTGGGPGSNTVK